MKSPSFFKVLIPVASTLFFLLMSHIPAKAQSYVPESLKVAASGISDGSSIIVRWVPADYETWKWGNEYGYRLERRRIDENAGPDDLVVLDSMIKPLTSGQWQALKDTSDMAVVAYEMIFNDSLEGQYLAGSDFLTIYQAQQGRENLFLFCLMAADRELNVALASGLAYLDNTTVTGQEYKYFVTPNNVHAGTALEKRSCKVATDDVYQPPAPVGLSSQSGDHSAIVGWAANPEYYGSYLIERSDDNGITWQQVNESPYFPSSGSDEDLIYFGDSISSNNTLFVYRVKGCSPFGLIGPPSDTIHVYGKPGPLEDGFPNFIDVEEVTPGELKLNWEFPVSLEGEIKGFEIYRSDEQVGFYEKISTSMLSTTTRSYVDTDPLPANYYKVVVVDDNDYELPSIPKLAQLEDTTPPSPPASVSGESNLSGIATLRWSPSPEPDVKGYRVFISNQPDGNFTQVTATWINDTVYHYGLNLNTLSEDVYFVVKAIDFRENMSEPSSVCTVQRPDIIPPAAPSISNVQAEAGKVHFEWALSSSEDVVGYKFQRKPNGSPGWTTLITFDTSQQIVSFTDSTASVHRYWDYRLLAEDDAGLLSSSKIIRAKPIDNGLRETIFNFTGSFANDANKVILEWDYQKYPDLAGFQIYRSFDSTSMQSYKFVTFEQAQSNAVSIGSSHTFAFLDSDLDFKIPVQSNYTTSGIDANTIITGGTVTVNGNTVTVVPQTPNIPQNPQNGVTLIYWVMAKFVDGAFSPLSQPVIIQIQ